MEKKKEKIFKKPRHEVTLVAQWRQMPHIKKRRSIFTAKFFFKSELEDLAPDNKTSDLSLIFFILDTYLKWEWDKKKWACLTLKVPGLKAIKVRRAQFSSQSHFYTIYFFVLCKFYGSGPKAPRPSK